VSALAILKRGINTWPFPTQLENRLDFFPVRKEHKYYLWDSDLIEDQGKCLENFVAVQLQRAVSAWIA
jgi:hypothetical protein